MKGYRAIKLEHESTNRGSVMYVKEEYYGRMVRIQETGYAKIGSEIMHILLDTQPATNIIGVYQGTDITKDKADGAHKVLNEKVKKRVERGKDCIIVGDVNAGINSDCNTFTQAARNILAWEESGKV